MGESREQNGFFGKYTEHFDDNGNKTGESRERTGFFGKYTEHSDTQGNKIGESREQDGFFGSYTEHINSSGNKTGESHEQEGFFGTYTEHVDAQGNKVGESRKRDGFFGRYTEHIGSGWRGNNEVSAGTDSTSTNSFPSSSGYDSPLSDAMPSDRSSSVASFIVFLVLGLFLLLLIVSVFGRRSPSSSYETRSHNSDVSISHESPLYNGGLSSRGIPAHTSPEDEKALAKDFDEGHFENK